MADRRSARSSAAAVLFALAATGGIAGCSGSTEPVRVPPLPTTFLFVKGGPGEGQIYRWFGDSIKPVTTGPGENVEPSAAAERIAFTSYRDGNAEIYLANLDGSGQHRIVTSTSFDNQPDLSPNATKVVFVSTRTGAQRLYTVDSSGAELLPLETGSAANVPETAPVWSPDGLRVAFTSSRTGTSQVFIVPAAGGSATQITHEAVGAFEPAWSANGDTIFFVASTGSTQVRATRITTGGSTTFPAASGGYAQPACGSFGCIAVQDPYGSAPQLVALQRNGQKKSLLDTGVGAPREPALVRSTSSLDGE